MSNPHSPTKPWLDGIATVKNGYYNSADEGDEGTVTVARNGVEYRVTVECLGDPDADAEPETDG